MIEYYGVVCMVMGMVYVVVIDVVYIMFYNGMFINVFSNGLLFWKDIYVLFDVGLFFVFLSLVIFVFMVFFDVCYCDLDG